MIVAYLALKGLSAREIQEDLTATLGPHPVAYSQVRGYLLPSSQDAPSAEVRRRFDDADQALLSALDENPFAFVRDLSRLTHIPPTTVYRCFAESIGLTARHLLTYN
jgi:hypothetical protein